MNNLISEKPVDVRKLVDVAYLVLILAAFAWAKKLPPAISSVFWIRFFASPCRFPLKRWHFPRAVAVSERRLAIAFALIAVTLLNAFHSACLHW